MKNLIKLIVVVLLVFLAKNLYEARYAKLIIGTWQVKGSVTEVPLSMSFDFIATYSEGGSSVSEGEMSIRLGGNFIGTAKIKSESTWRIEKNILIETPTTMRLRQSGGPSEAYEFFDALRQELKTEIGKETRVKILKLNKGLFKIEDEEGGIYIGTRKLQVLSLE